jgi:trk system potassium uptake protein TrkH
LQLRALVHPRQVRILKLDHRPVPQDVMQDILGFVILFVGFLVLATLLLAAVGMDLITAGSAVIACMSNVGPALGEVGPSKNYAALPAFAKVVLSFAMLLGRLEVSTVLVIFFGSLWRK